jgi:hypothetical protein
METERVEKLALRLKMNLALLRAQIKKLKSEISQLKTFSFRRCFGFPD